MNRKLILALSLVVAAMLALSGTARAACPIDDPDCGGGGGGPDTVTRTLHVVDSSQATLTATGINCGVAGDDCTEPYTYATDEEPPSVTLNATGVPAGYTAHLFKCTTINGTSCAGSETQCGVGSCTLEMSANYRVRLAVSDDTAPSTATVSGPSKAGPSVRHFTASASDGAGVVSYHFWLDGVDQGLFSPGAGYDVPTSLAQGTHTLTARGRDGAGNEGPLSAEKSFVFDHSANVSITGGPADGGHYATLPSLTFTHDDDAAPDGITCQTLKGAAVVDSSACTGTYVPVTSTDGDYTVKVLFVDDVGNQTTAQRSFTVDTGDPNVSITSPTSGQHVKTGLTPGYTATDGGTAAEDLATQCKLDAGAYSDCGPLTLSDGAHTLSVKSTDEAGNSRELSVDFVADSTGPQVTINSGPADDSIITSSSATYGWSSTDATTPLSQSCKLDGGAAAACTSPKTYAGLSEGSHTFTLKVTDALGNATEVSREVFVNAVRPSVAITSGPAEGAVLKSKSVTIGFKPAGGGAVSCSLDSETAYRPCSGATSDTLSNLSDGAHTFRVRVKDQSDDSAVASRAFAVDTSVAPPPPIKQIVKQILNPSLSSRFDRFRKYTVYKRLMLKRVPAGSTVSVKCKGKKCPAKSFHKKAHGTLKLAKFTKKKLRPGTKLTIRVTKPGMIGKQFVILIRKRKAPKLRISQIA